MTRDEALKKAAKLLRLANNNENANEAALAAAQAQKILDEHELNASMLELDGQAPEPDEPIVDYGQRAAPLFEARKLATWRWRLAACLAELNGCKCYVTPSIQIIGRPSDVEKVRYLFSYLASEVERLCDRDGKGCGTTWRNNFRVGCIDTISEKLHAARKQTFQDMRQNNATALVKVDQAIAKFQQKRVEVEDWTKKNLKLVSHSYGGGARQDFNARAAGRRAANEINIGGQRGALSGPKLGA
jgi:hypothetical protein